MAIRFICWARRNSLFGWALLGLAAVLWPVRWAFDRDPPFAITGPVTVVNAQAGGEVMFNAPVRRDLDRECSVMFARYMIDAAGFRRDFDKGPRPMSAEDLRAMDKRMNRHLQIAIPTAAGMPPGASVYTVNLLYRCNPLHALYPIEVTMTLPFEILP